MSELKAYKVIKGKIHTEVDGKPARLSVGDTFRATEKQIGGLISQVEEITPAVAANKAAVSVPPPPTQSAQSRGDDGRGNGGDAPHFELAKIDDAGVGKPAFNVIDSKTGKPVNEEPLFKSDAEALLQKKLGETAGA